MKLVTQFSKAREYQGVVIPYTAVVTARPGSRSGQGVK